jgi:hypothetical protein
MNLCRACGHDFGSLRAFDMHRTGKHAYSWSLERPDGRRCLTAWEMVERGLFKNSAGRWSNSDLAFRRNAA